MISSVGSTQQPLTLFFNPQTAVTADDAPTGAAGPVIAGTTANSETSGAGSPSTLFSPGVFEQLLGYQSEQSNGAASAGSTEGISPASPSSASTPADAAVQALMNLGAKEAATGQVNLNASYKATLFQIASSGNGPLTQTNLENNVIAGGGTAQDADALYAQLDPNGTGTISETQMAGQLATPVTASGSFGAALNLYLNGGQASTDLQNNLLQKLMKVGLDDTQASAVAQQLQAMS